jgi:hypothetical protein
MGSRGFAFDKHAVTFLRERFGVHGRLRLDAAADDASVDRITRRESVADRLPMIRDNAAGVILFLGRIVKRKSE